MTSRAALRNLSLAALASVSLGGCYYGDVYSASYAGADCSSRYGPSYWSNDPYAYDDATYGYDCYDAADYGSGFVQIGFGGGWYQQLYYPGYGLFLFDRYGRRHQMDQDYLSYWGGRRAWWKHHGHRYGNDARHDGRRPGRGYGGNGDGYPGSSDSRWNATPGAVAVPQNRQRGEGWRGRPRGAIGSTPSEVIAPAPVPGIEAAPPPPRRGSGGNGWGGRGAGQGGGNWTPPAATMPRVPEARRPEYREPSRGNEGAIEYVAPSRPAPQVSYTPPPAYNPPPPPRDERGPNRESDPIRED